MTLVVTLLIKDRVQADGIIFNHPISRDPWCFSRVSLFRQQGGQKRRKGCCGKGLIHSQQSAQVQSNLSNSTLHYLRILSTFLLEIRLLEVQHVSADSLESKGMMSLGRKLDLGSFAKQKLSLSSVLN